MSIEAHGFFRSRRRRRRQAARIMPVHASYQLALTSTLAKGKGNDDAGD